MHKHHHHRNDQKGSHHALLMAVLLTLGFALVEVIGSLWSGSLVLLSDAGHMASDALSLAISAFAAWIALKPPSHKHSYGLGRAEVIAAWISSVLMFIISLVVVIEAIFRIQHPPVVKSLPVMIVATLGILINLIVARILTRGKSSLNLRAAFLHVLGDLLGTGAALVSGIVIYFSGWTLIDPLLSIFIGILIMMSSIQLLREAMTILMEGVPPHLNLKNVSQALMLPGVKAVHDLHIWTLPSGSIALSAHIDIDNLSQWETILVELKRVLLERYRIKHITLQPEVDMMECEPCYK